MFIFRKFMFKKLMCKKLLFKYALSHQMMRRKSVASKKPVITSKPRVNIITTKKLCLLLTLMMTNCMSRVFAPAPDTRVTDAQIMAHYGITEETFSYWEEEARKDARIKVARSMAHCGKIEKDEKEERDVLEPLFLETLAKTRDHVKAMRDLANNLVSDRQTLLELREELLGDLQEVQERLSNGNIQEGLIKIRAALSLVLRKVTEKLQNLNNAIGDVDMEANIYPVMPNDLEPVPEVRQIGKKKDLGVKCAEVIEAAGGITAFAKKLSLKQNLCHKDASERMQATLIAQEEALAIRELMKEVADARKTYSIWQIKDADTKATIEAQRVREAAETRIAQQQRERDEANAQAAKDRISRAAAEARADRAEKEAAQPRYIYTSNSYDSEAKIAAADAEVEKLKKELEEEKNKPKSQPVYTTEEDSDFEDLIATGALVAGALALVFL